MSMGFNNAYGEAFVSSKYDYFTIWNTIKMLCYTDRVVAVIDIIFVTKPRNFLSVFSHVHIAPTFL